MSEKLLWKWFRNGVERVKPDAHVQRVENALSRGVLDVEGCIDGFSFWMELKSGSKPVRETSFVRAEPLSEEQIRFIQKRHQAGGFTCLLFKVGSGWPAEYYLVPGWYFEDLRAQLKRGRITLGALRRSGMQFPNADQLVSTLPHFRADPSEELCF